MVQVVEGKDHQLCQVSGLELQQIDRVISRVSGKSNLTYKGATRAHGTVYPDPCYCLLEVFIHNTNYTAVGNITIHCTYLEHSINHAKYFLLQV